jgi:hypothetical protein
MPDDRPALFELMALSIAARRALDRADALCAEAEGVVCDAEDVLEVLEEDRAEAAADFEDAQDAILDRLAELMAEADRADQEALV